LKGNFVVVVTVPEILVAPEEADLPARTLSKEDFPAPLGPIIAQTVLASTLK
jgi:hypothetical protein